MGDDLAGGGQRGRGPAHRPAADARTGPAGRRHPTEEGPHGLHWKTPLLVEWAEGRPFVWVDDEISAVDRHWVAAGHPALSLLHRVDPATGLRDTDFHVLTAWLDAVTPNV